MRCVSLSLIFLVTKYQIYRVKWHKNILPRTATACRLTSLEAVAAHRSPDVDPWLWLWSWALSVDLYLEYDNCSLSLNLSRIWARRIRFWAIKISRPVSLEAFKSLETFLRFCLFYDFIFQCY